MQQNSQMAELCDALSSYRLHVTPKFSLHLYSNRSGGFMPFRHLRSPSGREHTAIPYYYNNVECSSCGSTHRTLLCISFELFG